MPKFKQVLKTEQGKGWVQEREKKAFFFKKYFSHESLIKVNEAVLRELFDHLWSFGGWGKKDWLFQQMMQSGFADIKDAFRELLFGDKPLAVRFNVMKKIRMMGAASISEILAFHDPTKYPIWNRRARESLVKLGLSKMLLPRSSQIDGYQYENYSIWFENSSKK